MVEKMPVVQGLVVQLADDAGFHGQMLLLRGLLRGSLGIHRFRNLQDAPVVIGIFQRAGGTLVDVHIVRHVAQTVVVFVAFSACTAHFGMYGILSMQQALPLSQD